MSKALASHVASIRNIHPSLKTLLLLPAINPHLSLSHLQFDRSVIVPIFNLKTRAHYPSHFAPSVQQMSLNRSTLYYLLVFIISVRALIAVVVIAIIIGGIVGIQLQRTSYLNRSMGSLSVIVSNYTYMQRCPPDCNQTGEESTRQVLSAVPAPRYRGMVTWPGLPGTGACCLWCFFFFGKVASFGLFQAAVRSEGKLPILSQANPVCGNCNGPCWEWRVGRRGQNPEAKEKRKVDQILWPSPVAIHGQ